MRVLFLALGFTRLSTVIEEANEVAARGDSATVLVTTILGVNLRRFDPKVRVIKLADVVKTVPAPASWWLLFKAPQAAASVAARGPLRGKVRRAHHAYARRMAERAKKGTFKAAPVPGTRLYENVFDHVVWHSVLGARPFDVLVVADPASLPTAQRMVSAAHRAPAAATVAFTIDAVGAIPAQRRPSD